MIEKIVTSVIKVKQPPIRIISQGAFLERFDPDVRISIKNSEDPFILDFWDLIKSRLTVNLDYNKLHVRLEYIKSANFFNNPEDDMIKLLADGTKDELDF